MYVLSYNAHIFRDMQLLTMEEATVYEKKEKARKTLGVLQSQVHTMDTHVDLQ